MTINEQLEAVVAEIASMPEPTRWADLWVGPVNLAMWSRDNHDPDDEDRSKR